MPASFNSAISPYQSHLSQTRVTPEHAGALALTVHDATQALEASLDKIGVEVGTRHRCGYPHMLLDRER